MADIQVPFATPNAPQAVNPFAFIAAERDRQLRQNEDLNASILNVGSTYNQLHQQKLKNQLEALSAYSGIAGTSGITAANQMAPGLPGGMDTRYLPTDPFANPAPSQQPQQQPQQQPGMSPPPASGPAMQPQDAQPSPHIIAAHAAGLPDNTGLGAAHTQGFNPQPLLDQLDANNAEISKASHVGGSFSQDRSRKFTEANTGIIAQLGAQKTANDIGMQPTENSMKQQQLSNAQQAIPMEIGSKTAEIQAKYGAQDMKTQQGIKALQDFSDAWDAIPGKLKGPATGSLTSKAGSLFSGTAPELTTFNKIRENTASALATALLPETARANPAMVRELANTLPTAQSSPKEKANLIKNFYSQLENNAKLNYQGSQSAAGQFGGQIQQSKLPAISQNGGMVTIKDSQGGMHTLPVQNLQAAKQRDPGLQVIQ